jgi:para-aminobenzoate synthetase/4-amino-4-deoxychorismate lyase
VGVRLRRLRGAVALDPGLAVRRVPADGLPLVWFGLTDKPVPSRPLDATDCDTGCTASWHPAWTPQEHRRDVEHIRARIAQGETDQCNLTVRVRGHVTGDPFRFYRDLALGQAGPTTPIWTRAVRHRQRQPGAVLRAHG